MQGPEVREGGGQRGSHRAARSAHKCGHGAAVHRGRMRTEQPSVVRGRVCVWDRDEGCNGAWCGGAARRRSACRSEQRGGAGGMRRQGWGAGGCSTQRPLGPSHAMEGPRTCGIFYVCTCVGGCRTCIRGAPALCTTGTAASGAQELVSAHPMVHVSAHFVAPGPNYSDFGWPAGHGRAKNAATENDFFGSKSKNSKTFMRLSKNKEDTIVSGHPRALPFSSVFSTPARLEKCAGRALVNFFGPWTPKRAINRAFPRLRAQTLSGSQIEGLVSAHPMEHALAHGDAGVAHHVSARTQHADRPLAACARGAVAATRFGRPLCGRAWDGLESVPRRRTAAVAASPALGQCRPAALDRQQYVGQQAEPDQHGHQHEHVPPDLPDGVVRRGREGDGWGRRGKG